MKTLYKYLPTTLIFLLLVKCSNEDKQLHEIKIAGALKTIMQGDITKKITTDTLWKYPNLYGLGAVENLQGEILMLNSKLFIAKEKNKKVIVEHNKNVNAALLVYTSVNKWMPAGTLPAGNMKELETYILQQATQLGIDTDKPFPFLLKGKAPELKWHVIHWDINDKQHSHYKHITSGANGQITDMNVEILGFHSLHHQRIFTHHTSNIHMHFILPDKTLSGHIDDIITNKNLILYLPENFKK